MKVSRNRKDNTEYNMVTARHPQKAKADVCFTLLISLEPSALETALEPPTPNRFDIAERNMKAGMQTVTAVSMASFPVRPTKNVSAMLYMTRIICPITVGKANLKIAPDTLHFSNNSISFSVFTDYLLLYVKNTHSFQVIRLYYGFWEKKQIIHINLAIRKFYSI
jgi:hypothetical protein